MKNEEQNQEVTEEEIAQGLSGIGEPSEHEEAETSEDPAFVAAKEDFNDFLAARRTKKKTIEANEDVVKLLAEAIVEKDLVVTRDESGNVTGLKQVLRFGIDKKNQDGEKTGSIDDLQYSVRLPTYLVQEHLKGVKQDDQVGRIVAHVAAATGQPKAIIRKIENTDYTIASLISVFFIQP